MLSPGRDILHLGEAGLRVEVSTARIHASIRLDYSVFAFLGRWTRTRV
jgi:hypothetical protein